MTEGNGHGERERERFLRRLGFVQPEKQRKNDSATFILDTIKEHLARAECDINVSLDAVTVLDTPSSDPAGVRKFVTDCQAALSIIHALQQQTLDLLPPQ